MSDGADTALYAWIAEHPEQGWTQIMAEIPELKMRAVLTHRKYDIVTRPAWRAIAEHHRRTSGQPVKLVAFTNAEVLEELP